MRTLSNLRTCVAVVLCFVLWGSELRAAEILPLPPHSVVEGRQMHEWSVAWWKWALSQTRPNDAFSERTGALAGVNQSGPVYFLSVTNGGAATRTFSVPAGKYVYVPVAPFMVSNRNAGGTTEADLRRYADQENEDVTMFASINGVAVRDVASHHETTPVGTTVSFDAPPNNAVFSPSGRHEPAITDEWILMLPPLPPGLHTIRYGMTDPSMNYTTDVTARITVVPEPDAAGVLGLGCLTLLRRTRRRTDVV